ncbi:MAG: DegV family protein [Oscillospiraceae bacterium]|nr:DegV family protein [Oscillospiraceae bacterium]
MPMLRISCDSACDLTAEMRQQYDIAVPALGITLGDELRYDGVDVTPQELFDYVKSSGELPKTSAVSVGVYEELFRSLRAGGEEVVHLSLSGELSSCHQNACIAAQMVGGVSVVDTRSLSLGGGHLAIRARELANAGMDAKAVAAQLETEKEKLDVSFVLQTLDHLYKGGRCPGVAVLGANLLKIRPEIAMANGKLGLGRKYRGTAEKSVLDYFRGKLEGKTDIDTKKLIIVHSGMEQAIVEKAAQLVRELQPFETVEVHPAGCTISTHAGPECIGCLIVHK